MKLQLHETDLVGKWIAEGGKVRADATCERINQLVAQSLQQVATDETGWDVLYRDPDDGRYWELIYPDSHMQGGGPPRLFVLSSEQVRAKYQVEVAPPTR